MVETLRLPSGDQEDLGTSLLREGSEHTVIAVISGRGINISGSGTNWPYSEERFELVTPAKAECADECAVCGGPACNSEFGNETAKHHDREWRLCEKHWESGALSNSKAIYERHIKPKEHQVYPDWKAPALPKQPVAEQPKPDPYKAAQVGIDEARVYAMQKAEDEQTGRRARLIAALKAEQSRPVTPRFPSVGRDDRVYRSNRDE